MASRKLDADGSAEKVARECAPTATAVVKELLWQALDLDQHEVRRRELALFDWLGGRTDAREGVAAWLQRRPPQWTGSPADRPPWWPAP